MSQGDKEAEKQGNNKALNEDALSPEASEEEKILGRR